MGTLKLNEDFKMEIDEPKKAYRWKCTVCGEITEGVEPPKVCPVCGVDSNYFIRLEDSTKVKISDKYESFVIIGSGGAGMSAAEEIRSRNKNCDITVISKEAVKGYYRPQLSKMLSKGISSDLLSIKDDSWYKENNVKLLLNTEVTGLDIAAKQIYLSDDKKLEYTKLIFASGAECFMPPITGNDKKGVFTLRYFNDVIDIREYAKGKRYAAVIGGGVLGLETASELNNMGLEVTVIEMADRILPRQLDHQSSLILEELVKNAGVRFRKNASTKEIIGTDIANGVLLVDGEIINADIIVVSTGVRSNSQIAQNSGIEVKRAIVVNEKMETNVPDIYACGDCCEYEGINYALWSEAIEQGKTAGINAAGDEYIYNQIIPSTTLNAFNTGVFSVGDIGSNVNDDYQVYEFKHPDGKNYKKLYFKGGQLVGGILVGDTSKTVKMLEGFEKGRSMEEMIKSIE